MNKSELRIIIVLMVTMNLLDNEVERSYAAFLDKGREDSINEQAQRLAEERGSTLLHLGVPESAVLYVDECEELKHAI